ncbi:MAG: hypothetical protein ACOYMW_13980 [Candidatus Competibacteraceae bacterium]
MSDFLRIDHIRDVICSSHPVISQDVWLLIFFWFLASLPWIIGFNFIPFDSVNSFYPQSHFVIDSIRQGDWPWWNPYQYAGLPVFGDPQGMLFTLHTLVGVLLGSHYTLHAFDIVTLLHPMMGGIAILALGYSRGVPRAWLLAAALVFMLGGVATSRLQHVPQIVSYGWLPVLLWLLLAVNAKPKPWRALLLGVLAALWAANANQVVFLGGIFLAMTAICTLVRSPDRPRLLAMYLLAGFVTLILLAPVYSAMFEIVGLSGRAKFSLANSTSTSFPLLVYSSLIFPALYGNLGGKIWGPTDITQDYLYIGIVPLSLYMLAIFSGIRWRNKIVFIWLLTVVFFVLLSLGINSPLYPFLYDYFPGFNFFKRPADAAYLINFILAIGLLIVGREAAYSFSLITNGESRSILPIQRRLLMIVVALGVTPLAIALGSAAQSRDALGVLYGSYTGLVVRLVLFILLLVWLNHLLGKSKRFYWVALLVGGLFIAVDLGATGRYKGAFSPRYSDDPHIQNYQTSTPPKEDSLDAWLKSQTMPWARVEVIGGFASQGHSSKAQWHNTQGYNPISLVNYSHRIGTFPTRFLPRTFPQDSDGPLDWRYNVLGLRYVAFEKKLLNQEQHQPIAEQAKKYRNVLVKVGGKSVFADDDYEIWSRLGPSLWLAITQSESFEDLIPAPCEVKKFKNIYLEISCEMNNSGTLVLGEVQAPGWIACVNDQPMEIKPFFDVFRSVYLPKGSSTLIMTYRPIPFFRRPPC